MKRLRHCFGRTSLALWLTAVIGGMLLAAWTFARAAGAPAESGPPAPVVPPASLRPLRIGYLRPEAPAEMNAEWFRGLRRYLESDPACADLREAMTRRYNGISLVAAESYDELVQRMQPDEPDQLDVVFAPAVAYADQPRVEFVPPLRFEDRPNTPIASLWSPNQRAGDYSVVFQIKRPGDSGRYPAIYRRGVLIVNRSHPLYRPATERADPVPPQVIARHFAAEPVALVSRYSAPGYIDPVVALYNTTGGLRTSISRPVFCGSSEEVVKMVLSNVVAMGACEDGTVEEVLKRHGVATPAEQAVEVILTLNSTPTDPVIFLREIHPTAIHPTASALGRLLKRALETYFNLENPPGQIRLAQAEDGDLFRRLRQQLGEFRKYIWDIDRNAP